MAMVGSAVLARSVGVLGAVTGVPTLRGAGGFQRWVLEQPLPLAIGLPVVGVVAWFVLRGQGKEKQGRIAGGVLIALGAIVFGIGSLVTTEGEKLKARTRTLINAIATADVNAARPLLANDVAVMPWAFSFDEILKRLETDMRGQYRVKEHSIPTVRAQIDAPTLGKTQVRVRATPENGLYGGPMGSWWLLTWRKSTAGEWQVVLIEAQQIDFVKDPASLRP